MLKIQHTSATGIRHLQAGKLVVAEKHADASVWSLTHTGSLLNEGITCR